MVFQLIILLLMEIELNVVYQPNTHRTTDSHDQESAILAPYHSGPNFTRPGNLGVRTGHATTTHSPCSLLANIRIVLDGDQEHIVCFSIF